MQALGERARAARSRGVGEQGGGLATLVLARRGLRDARIRTVSFALLFAVYAYIQPVGYRHA